ncbi:MAG: UPF0182 family protein [Nitrospinae bacterium]|nr:UPF0182 family protein [Nitrospinota bacterium]
MAGLLLVLGLGALLLGGEGVRLYTDWLWFQEVGYTAVFLKILGTQIWLGIACGLLSALFLWINLSGATRSGMDQVPMLVEELEELWETPHWNQWTTYRRILVLVASLGFGLLVGAQASGAWETWLRYVESVPFGQKDPLFGREVSFYVFTLPLWRQLHSWFMLVVFFSLLGTGVAYFLEGKIWVNQRGVNVSGRAKRHLSLLGGLGVAGLAIGFYLGRYELLYSSRSMIFGASYADVEALLPALTVLSILAGIGSILFFFYSFRPQGLLPWVTLGLLAVAYILGGHLYPLLLQRLVVLPNELGKETPYIARNIVYTRQAYGLEDVEERRLSAEAALGWQDLQENQSTLQNIRLWDRQPLLETFSQIQEIRTYYAFASVDNDRYRFNGDYRQVMLSPREISSSNLPSRTWINEHQVFTHGYGLTLGLVNRVTAEGLPELLIKDIPPATTVNLKVERPELYYGELTDPYVFLRTRSKEFDYPAGEENVYSQYQGRGGVPLSSSFRKALFALRFGSLKTFLSQDITSESRALFYRRIDRRVRRIAPFLRYDRDPYLVISGGRLYWIYDAYTTTDRYPYSLPIRGVGNYIRNSVKAVIDAYHGEVKFYIADPRDPIIRTYSRIFPGTFLPLEAMPEDLRRHLRYPEDLFALQTHLYATYHMTTPQVFYNKEDLWEIPSGIGKEGRPMEPYYMIMKLPQEKREEFILMSPFNPKGKDNLAAWMVAKCDLPEYGKLVVYRFPKQKLVYGPKQIEARINQDAEISRQVSLWDQRGSQVILGTLLVIPVKESLIYVQPLYLKAENGKIPELKRVIVAYENHISMEETLEEALSKLFQRPAVAAGEAPSIAEAPAAEPGKEGERREDARPRGEGVPSDPAAQAWEHLQKAKELQRGGDWAGYGEELKRLEEALKKLRR